MNLVKIVTIVVVITKIPISTYVVAVAIIGNPEQILMKHLTKNVKKSEIHNKTAYLCKSINHWSCIMYFADTNYIMKKNTFQYQYLLKNNMYPGLRPKHCIYLVNNPLFYLN